MRWNTRCSMRCNMRCNSRCNSKYNLRCSMRCYVHRGCNKQMRRKQPGSSMANHSACQGLFGSTCQGNVSKRTPLEQIHTLIRPWPHSISHNITLYHIISLPMPLSTYHPRAPIDKHPLDPSNTCTVIPGSATTTWLKCHHVLWLQYPFV